MLPQIKICLIIGARPQFIKHAPLEIELKKHFSLITIHTGQHYDESMSNIFFNELKIDRPKYQLNIGSGNHGQQTGRMLEGIENILVDENPDGIIVYGDTNSTLAGALAGSKLSIPIFHVEAGLRSFNKNMPEEINRIVTDHVSELLFVPTEIAQENLFKEGINSDKVFLVGDIMYDSLLLARKFKTNLTSKNQILVTLHRPYNTDNIIRLENILKSINDLGKKIVFPIHPRTKSMVEKYNFNLKQFNNIEFCSPLSYFDLIGLQIESSCIITDSGGIQKEAYLNKKKCITLRSETEWNETLTNGWNILVYENLNELKKYIGLVPGEYIEGVYGSGDTASKITNILVNYYSN
jgi:UDP-GlcNAc3NAcA epimerase